MPLFLAPLLTQIFGSQMLKFIALKAILTTLIVIVLPVVLWNLGIEWVSMLMSYAVSFLPQGGFIADFTGVAGWLLSTANIPQCVEIILSAYATSLVLRFLSR